MHGLLATCGDYCLPTHFAAVFNEFLGNSTLAMVPIHDVGMEGAGCSTCNIAKLGAPTGVWLALDFVSQLHGQHVGCNTFALEKLAIPAIGVPVPTPGVAERTPLGEMDASTHRGHSLIESGARLKWCRSDIEEAGCVSSSVYASAQEKRCRVDQKLQAQPSPAEP